MNNQDGNQPYPSYAPLAANLTSAPVVEEVFIPGGRRRPGRNGLAWISSAWKLFKRQPGTWILSILANCGISVFSLVILFVLGRRIIIIFSVRGSGWLWLIVLIGPIIVPLLIGILFIPGIVYACDRLRREKEFAFGDLFAGFSHRTGSLMIIGLLTLCFSFAVDSVMRSIRSYVVSPPIGFSSSFLSHSMLSNNHIIRTIGAMMFVGVSSLRPVGIIAVAMAVWFAPTLVAIHNLSVFEAMKMSFAACLKNILPVTVFSIVIGILLVAISISISISIPFRHGLPITVPIFLITMPMFWICSYTSYRDIFFDDSGERSR